MINDVAGRHTNVAILWATLAATVSGVGAFLVGTEPGAWVIIAHGVVALVLVVLIPWKSTIVRRGLSRGQRGRVWSVVLTVLTVLTIASGVGLVAGEIDGVGPLTMMQIHVGAAVVMLMLTLAHTAQRPHRHRRMDVHRRNVVRSFGLTAAAAGLWLAVESILDISSLRGRDRRFTGSHEIIEPPAVPVTQWLNDRVQHLDRNTHRVMVVGRELGVEMLEGEDEIEATLDCTGGWYTTQTWRGTRLVRLLGEADGASIVVRSTTGYWRRFPLDQGGDLYLATHMAGQPLRDGNGGPVRLVAPGRRGYWWVKWVTSVDVDDTPPWWQPPLPMA